MLTEPAIWDILEIHNLHSIVVGAPLASPDKPTSGDGVVSLSPLIQFYPKKSKEEELLSSDSIKEVHEYTETKRNFITARSLLATKQWDFFMMLESSIREKQSLYVGNPAKILEHYKYIDDEIGSILPLIPAGTRIFIVSGYGSKRVEGIFHLNEWLMQEGYLNLKTAPQIPAILTEDLVNWKDTRAWGAGGNFGFIWLNMSRRESRGVIPKEKYEYTRNRLIHKIISLTDPNGIPLYAKVFKPSKIYSRVTNVPPDLLLCFRNLSWRSSSMIGTGDVHSDKIGIDDSVNSTPEGIFISSGDQSAPSHEELSAVHISDIAPTILTEFGIDPLKKMCGKVIPL